MLLGLQSHAFQHLEQRTNSFASPAGETFWTASLVQSVLHLCGQAVALTHRDRSLNGDHIGVVDDPVHDGIADRAVLGGVGIDPFIPSVRIYWVQKMVEPCLVRASMISNKS